MRQIVSGTPIQPSDMLYEMPAPRVVRWFREARRVLDLETQALLLVLGHGGFAIGMAIKLLV